MSLCKNEVSVFLCTLLHCVCGRNELILRYAGEGDGLEFEVKGRRLEVGLVSKVIRTLFG